MDKKEFLERLEALLSDLPEDDRLDALDYYQGYLDEAGENTAKVLEELGSPEELADLIRSGLGDGPAAGGAFTDSGYMEPGPVKKRYELAEKSDGSKGKEDADSRGQESDSRGERAASRVSHQAYSERGKAMKEDTGDEKGDRAGQNREKYVKGSYARESRKKERMAGWQIVLCIAGVILLWPFILALFGLGIAGVGVFASGLFSVIVTLAGFLLTVGVITGSLLIGGAVISVLALIGTAAQPAAGFLFFGIGLIMMGCGLVALVLAILFYGTFLPWVFRKLGSCFRGRRKEENGNGSKRGEADR